MRTRFNKLCLVIPLFIGTPMITVVASEAAVIPSSTPNAASGTTHLSVDISDVTQAIYRVEMTIPVSPGPLTLAYPEWIPGAHAPGGPIRNLAGLVITVNDRRLQWTRDPVNMYEFHLTVPQGASSLEIKMNMLGMQNVDPYLCDMDWSSVLLYPLGKPVWDYRYQANLTLPDGWKYATALTTTAHHGNTIQFAPSSLYMLVDSPVMAGAFYRQLPLATSPRVSLDLFADNARLLTTMSAKIIADYRRLPAQEYLMFGSYHYKHYDFLMALSNFVSNGTEHHESSEDGAGANYFADPDRMIAHADLLTHEYTHSWNGKFMRPEGQVQPTYQDPRDDGMLWIYEGLTQYIGQVMAARIGLWSKQTYREQLAYWAAHMAHRTGRSWRDLEDTTVASPLRFGTSRAWSNYTRGNGTDTYRGGVLLWLDVDTKIRELSRDQRSLNNFCKLFFGGEDRSTDTIPYSFDDLVAALNEVQPYNWATFLRNILYRSGPDAKAPLDGIERGGWKLVYTPIESPFMKVITQHYIYGNGTGSQFLHEMDSIGLDVSGEGEIIDVLWNGPAFKAGLAPGMTIIAINGRSFTPKAFVDAIVAAQNNEASIKLLVKHMAWRADYEVNYHGGLRYPHLERIEGVPDYLDQILSPMRAGG